jgi:hypothetical protein
VKKKNSHFREKYSKLLKKLTKFLKKEAEDGSRGLVICIKNKRLGIQKGNIELRDVSLEQTINEYIGIQHRLYIKGDNNGYLIFIWESLSNKPTSHVVILPQYICKHRLGIRKFPYLSKNKKEVGYSVKTLIENGMHIDRDPDIENNENQI